MKNAIIVILVSLSILAMTASGYCEDNALKKLGRGMCNLGTCWMEAIEQPSRLNNSDGPFAGLTYGVLKGLGMTVVRAVVGAYEIVTFPIPLPENYKPILQDPEFFFEEKNW